MRFPRARSDSAVQSHMELLSLTRRSFLMPNTSFMSLSRLSCISTASIWPGLLALKQLRQVEADVFPDVMDVACVIGGFVPWASIRAVKGFAESVYASRQSPPACSAS